jgi:4'-phosphopantetheinyl transferase
MIPLQDQIHLWLADYEQIDYFQIRDHRGLLNEEERKQESKFYFERDRRRYFVTRALVRKVLSRYEPVTPENWIFATNAYGRPEIANAAIGKSGLSFNISHTHSLIVLGVTRGRALGVDVENVRTREVSIDVAYRFFSPTEAAALGTVAPGEQQDRFFEYWTFKESYIKARGMGLSIPLDKFSFRYPHASGVEIAIHPELADHPGRWQFWQLRPAPEYLLAVCAERTGALPPSIVVRNVVSMDAEEILEVQFSRTSEQAT